jgi:hypothetical protein
MAILCAKNSGTQGTRKRLHVKAKAGYQSPKPKLGTRFKKARIILLRHEDTKRRQTLIKDFVSMVKSCNVRYASVNVRRGAGDFRPAEKLKGGLSCEK